MDPAGGKGRDERMNSDESVALGTAMQSRGFAGEEKGATFPFAAPLSPGVETSGGAAAELTSGDAANLTEKSEIFSTSLDSQPSLEIAGLQSEQQFADGPRAACAEGRAAS